MEHRDYFIHPFAKLLVSIIAGILCIVAVICALSMAGCGVSFFTTDISFPFDETVCTFQYIASVCLLVLAPWCINTLLAGRGTPFMRFCGYGCILFLPMGVILTGFDAPWAKLFASYSGLLAGHPLDEQGYYLMRAFNFVGKLQVSFACLVVPFTWIYTTGYSLKNRRILLAWSILWLTTALVESLINYLYLESVPLPNIIFWFSAVLSIVCETAFWLLTAWFAGKLCVLAPRIASMPETSKHNFPAKQEDTTL